MGAAPKATAGGEPAPKMAGFDDSGLLNDEKSPPPPDCPKRPPPPVEGAVAAEPKRLACEDADGDAGLAVNVAVLRIPAPPPLVGVVIVVVGVVPTNG